MHDKKDFFFSWWRCFRRKCSKHGAQWREREGDKVWIEGRSTLRHKKRFKLARMKDKHFQSTEYPENYMGCGWLQGYSSCSATYRFQGQSLILSCDITACAGSCWDESWRPQWSVLASLVPLKLRMVRMGQFGITPWLPHPQVTQGQPQTLLPATAQLPLPGFKVSWRCWRGRNGSRNSCGGHQLWKMLVSFPSYPTEASAWKWMTSGQEPEVQGKEGTWQGKERQQWFCAHEFKGSSQMSLAGAREKHWDEIWLQPNNQKKESMDKWKLKVSETDLEKPDKD